MTVLHLRHSERARPLVVVVCAVPLLGEAMMSALEFAEVRSFSEHGGDIGGLIEWLRPDAVVVDSAAGAENAAQIVSERGMPLVHIEIRERGLRVLRDGEWHQITSREGPTPEVIRNVIAGALFARTAERTQ